MLEMIDIFLKSVRRFRSYEGVRAPCERAVEGHIALPRER